MRRVFLIAGFFALSLAGCHSKTLPATRRPRGSKADAARKQAEAIARDAVIGAASEVQARAEPRRGGSSVGWFAKAAQLVVEAAILKDALTSEVGAQQPPRSPAPPRDHESRREGAGALRQALAHPRGGVEPVALRDRERGRVRRAGRRAGDDRAAAGGTRSAGVIPADRQRGEERVPPPRHAATVRPSAR